MAIPTYRLMQLRCSPRRFGVFIAQATVLLALASSAAAADKPGSKDFASISRFKGSEITEYQASDFDEALLPIKPMSTDSPSPASFLKVEGKVVSILYRAPEGKSTLEVMRNYEQALGSGYKIVFKCDGDECGQSLAGRIGNQLMPNGWRASFNTEVNRYLLAQRTGGVGGDLYVLVYVMKENSYPATVFQRTVEMKPMAGGQVSVVDAATLKRGLDSDGKVAVYGVFFDTAKAEVKPESKASLDEMAKLLAANPALKVYIVGHTDNAGNLSANLDLSQRRAEAVVKALASTYRIDPQRLAARGVASLAPVASNTDDAGRARNRRVELVVQ